MIDKKGGVDYITFWIEIIGALIISFGVFTIPLRLFGNELVSELIVAVGTIIMIVGRFFR